MYANGLLEGLNDFRPTDAMTREDAMQLFANLLQADGTAAMSDTETAQTLASVKDAGSISRTAEMRLHCVCRRGWCRASATA